VLARRDECSASLRRRAVMMVAQKEGPRREEILLGVVRNDPDVRVREQGVFWLSQTQSERAVEILNDLLRTSTDDRLRDRALFGLSQQKSAAATRTLREFAERRDAPRSLRERAIFWLGQREGGADGAYLRELYGKLDDAALKERVLFSLSQASSAENQRFLLGVARNGSETAVLRGKAIFWLGQSDGMPTSELGALYEQMDDRQVKEQLVFAISQRTNDPEAVDVLMRIASSDSDRRLRERAIFWLGQSKDPRAVQYIMSIIDR
jgi:HEAT repeat protein